MIFTQEHCDLILAGKKTETRRVRDARHTPYRFPSGAFQGVRDNGRILWQVGRLYSLQPGRGRLGIGYIGLLAINTERLWRISFAAIAREGYATRDAYRAAWDRINRRPGTRWDDNPVVWVLRFKLVTKGTDDGDQ